MPKNASQNADGFRLPTPYERMAYLAGFFDGEGSIYPRNGLQVSAAQIERAPLLMLQAALGGRVTDPPTGRRSPVSNWVIYGRPAARALAAMLPWLVVKQQQAYWALDYAKLVRAPGDAHYGRQVDDETKQERERLRQLIMKSRNGASNRREDRLELPRATA